MAALVSSRHPPPSAVWPHTLQSVPVQRSSVSAKPRRSACLAPLADDGAQSGALRTCCQAVAGLLLLEAGAAGARWRRGWRRPSPARRRAGAAVALDAPEQQDQQEEQELGEADAFDWSRAWYPLSPVSYLHKDKPNPLMILGQRVVVWMSVGVDGSEEWHATADACPHRMAPLSIGEVLDDGTLRCRYHGWCFSGDGKCVKVPMANGPEEESKMCGLGRSAVAAFPTAVRQGLLWVFPSSGREAAALAAASEPHLEPECEGTDWVMTVAPVGYEVSVENTFDPSHAPFLHDGIIKYAPERAVPMARFAARDGEISGKGGFVLEHDGYDEGTKDMEATRKFVPPCSNTTVYKYADGRVQTNQLYFVPCGPHETRYLVPSRLLGFSPKKEGAKPPGRLASFFGDVKHAVFFNRIFGYRFQEQDLTAMRGQEQVLSSRPGRNWGEQYVLGTPSDAGVEVFRRWLYQHAGGGPAWAGEQGSAGSVAPESRLYDRWERHAKHCPQCRRVLRALGRLETAASRLSAAGVAAGAAAAALGRPAAAALGVCSALAAAGVRRWAASERWGFISSVPQHGPPEVQIYKD